MGTVLDIATGQGVLSLSGSFSLSIPENSRVRVRSKPKNNKVLDNRRPQHGLEYDLQADIWDSGFDLRTLIQNLRDERLDVWVHTQNTSFLMKGTSINLSEDSDYRADKGIAKLKLRAWNGTEGDVTASIRNLLSIDGQTGSFEDAHPDTGSFPAGWTWSGSGMFSHPNAIASFTEASGKTLGLDANAGDKVWTIKPFVYSGRLMQTFSLLMHAITGGTGSLQLNYYSGSELVASASSGDFHVKGGLQTTAMAVTHYGIVPPTSHVECVWTCSIAIEGEIDNAQLEMGAYSPYVTY